MHSFTYFVTKEKSKGGEGKKRNGFNEEGWIGDCQETTLVSFFLLERGVRKVVQGTNHRGALCSKSRYFEQRGGGERPRGGWRRRMSICRI